MLQRKQKTRAMRGEEDERPTARSGRPQRSSDLLASSRWSKTLELKQMKPERTGEKDDQKRKTLLRTKIKKR